MVDSRLNRRSSIARFFVKVHLAWKCRRSLRGRGATMKIGMPRSVVDLYEWLPGYGESAVSIASEGSSLRVTVRYERDCEEEMQLMERDLIFIYSPVFLRHSFPGDFLFEMTGGTDGFTVGHLSEFGFSEFCQAYGVSQSIYSPSRLPEVKHYSVQFLAENLGLHILASGVELGPERVAGY